MRNFLFLCAVFLCLGIIWANLFYLPAWLFYISASSALFFCFIFRHRIVFFLIFVYFIIFQLGAILYTQAKKPAGSNIANFIFSNRDFQYALKGFINSPPVVYNNQASFVFSAQEIQWDSLNYGCSGNILVRAKGESDLHYGQALILRGNLYRPFQGTNNQAGNYRAYLYRQGITALMNIKSPCQLYRLEENKGNKIRAFAFWLKERIEAGIYKHLNPLAASILDAMVLGEKRNIPAAVTNAMLRTGTVHILVVSGFNVGIVAFIIIIFLKLIRIPQTLRILLACPLIILYCLATGASNPVLRATVMAVTILGAQLFKREPDIYNALGLAAIFILALNPLQLFDIGFQLSFVSVISIVWFYAHLKKLLRVERLRFRIIRLLLESFLVSFSAWLGTLGLIACYFRIFSPVTVIANIFIVPLASLITLSGFCVAFSAGILPGAAGIFAASTEFLILLLLNLNNFLVNIPGAYFYLG